MARVNFPKCSTSRRHVFRQSLKCRLVILPASARCCCLSRNRPHISATVNSHDDTRFPGISSGLNLIHFIEILRQCGIRIRSDAEKPLFPFDLLCPLAILVSKEREFLILFRWFCVRYCCHVFFLSGVVAGVVSMKTAARIVHKHNVLTTSARSSVG